MTCDTCMYDFAAGDGQVKCDHATCPTAIRLTANVPVYKAWVEMVVAEARGRSPSRRRAAGYPRNSRITSKHRSRLSMRTLSSVR